MSKPGMTARALGVLVVATVLAALGPIPAQAQSAPNDDVPARAVELLFLRSTEGFVSQVVHGPMSMVAITVDRDTGIEIRHRTEASWSPWEPVEMSPEHRPDDARWRPASEPIWTDSTTGVQVRAAKDPGRATLYVIDTSDSEAVAPEPITDSFLTGSVPQPAIYPRSAWDPNNDCEPRQAATETQVTHAFVHHTSATQSANEYSASEVPDILLGYCLYHRDGRGWDDIAYNFLIDRFGNIWEGRAGGIDKGIQGGHTYGMNYTSFGVALIGAHNLVPPSAATQDALVALLAWKASIHNLDPTISQDAVTGGSAKSGFFEGATVNLEVISGHRDAQATSCPGSLCYAQLPAFRAQAGMLVDAIPYDTFIQPLTGDFNGDGLVDGAVMRSATGEWMVTVRDGSGGASTDSWADYSSAYGWDPQMVGDFNGDGRDDIANFHPGNGSWWVSKSIGSAFSTRRWADFTSGSGWKTHVVGDFDGDGRDDIANFHPSNGTWWVSRSGGYSFSTSLWADFSTASGWTSQVVGDFNGDGRDDIANFHPGNGTWWVSISTGSRFVTSLWADFSTASGWTTQIPGDFNGDGRDDIANYHPGTDKWWISTSNGSSFSTTYGGLKGSIAPFVRVDTVDTDGDGADEITVLDRFGGYWWVGDAMSTNPVWIDAENMVWHAYLGASRVDGLDDPTHLTFSQQDRAWLETDFDPSGAATTTVVEVLTP